MLLHTLYALQRNMTFICIMSNDTDTVILALGKYHYLRSQHIFDDIVIEYGLGKNMRKISIKNLATSLGQTRSEGMVFYHSFTRCDTCSSFKMIGKKKAYETIKAFPEIEILFSEFQNNPFPEFDINDEKFKKIERFVILMYNWTADVNEAREYLYFNRSFNIENVPPTKDALYLHTRRALYQSGIWARCLEAYQRLPSPRDFGWVQSNDPIIKWTPHWMTQPEGSKEIRELWRCGCKTNCSGSARCKCFTAGLTCTMLCTSCQCPEKHAYNNIPNWENHSWVDLIGYSTKKLPHYNINTYNDYCTLTIAIS